MATIVLNVPSKNGQASAITGTFSSLKEGKVNLTTCTLGDASTVAVSFPGYVSIVAADAMSIPATHIVSIA